MNTPTPATEASDAANWKERLRAELRMSAMKDVFTLSRDEVIELMGETAISLMSAPAAAVGGGELQPKMQSLMYSLTKAAARSSYREFLEDLDISEDDYEQIKAIWKDRLGVEPYV